MVLDSLIAKYKSAVSRKRRILLCLCCFLLGGILCLIPAVRDSLKKNVAEMVDNATKGTPLDGSGKYFRDQAKDLQASKELEGNEIRGLVNVNGGLFDNSLAKDGKKIAEKVLEDAHLTKQFVWDLAVFLTTNYNPHAKTGQELCSLVQLNTYLGGRMNVESLGGRTALLRYVFQSTMLQGLYHLYVQYFLDAIKYCAEKKFSSDEIQAFYGVLEQRIGSYAQALTAIVSSSELGEKLKIYDALADEYEDIHAKLTLALYDREQLESQKDSDAFKEVQDRIETLTVQENFAKQSMESALQTMIEGLNLEDEPLLDTETLLFLILWVQRRVNEGAASEEAVATAIEILYDLQSRFRRLVEKAMGEEPKKPNASMLDENAPYTEDQGHDGWLEDSDIVEKREQVPAKSDEKDPYSFDDGLPAPIQIPVLPEEKQSVLDTAQ